MPARRLEQRPVERVWGRRELPGVFGPLAEGAPIGEIWFEQPGGLEPDLLVKYLFTSERLSIQVHPNDSAARARGHRSGKDEAWLVLEAEPGAVIGLGLEKPLSREELKSAALDGSIETLIDWRPVQAGDSFYSPAGTIHAIGGGVALIEIQQNVDITYRLYDYGRPRALNVDEAVSAASLAPYAPFVPRDHDEGRRILAAGGAFVMESWRDPRPRALRCGEGAVTFVPLSAGAALDGHRLEPGSVWSAEGDVALDSEGGCDLLVAYPGAATRAFE